MHAHVVLSLFSPRTEELRALTWDHLSLDARPPSMQVWRFVRHSGDTKTAKFRRTLELAERCDVALEGSSPSADGGKDQTQAQPEVGVVAPGHVGGGLHDGRAQLVRDHPGRVQARRPPR